MKNTTLCYLEKDDCYLMLHRIKKQQDENQGKWIGIGGKFEEGESPIDCLVREVQEETGLHLTGYQFRGIVTFVSDEWGTEQMHLFTGHEFEGELLQDCPEGRLQWVNKNKLKDLPMWEGDRIFFDLLQSQQPFFVLKLCYQGEELVQAFLDGKELPLKQEETK